MATVAVLGGGISGLSCAYYLKTLGKSKIKYLFLLERSPKFGGWIKTTKFPNGAVFEHGPRTLRVGGESGYNILSLAEELSLSSQILPISRLNPVAKKRYILVRNQLHELPNSLSSVFRTVPPFSKPLLGAFIKDFKTKKSELNDECVYDFAQRRLGKEVADYIFDPLCRGICAGDAREISVRSLFPSLFKGEKAYGSIIKSIFAESRATLNIPQSSQSQLYLKSKQERWSIWSLREGLAQIIDTLACAVEESGVADLHVNAECTKLTFKNNKALVMVDGENIEVDHVFSSIPASNLSTLIEPHKNISSKLRSIPAVSVAVVYLEYQQNVLKVNGFGFLTPSTEDAKVLGITFDSCCFPQLNGTSNTRLTCMMGGKWFEKNFGDVNSTSKEIILKTALEAVKKHLGITDAPTRQCVVVQKNCIPQYLIGHDEKLEEIYKEIAEKDLCLSLLGASYHGAGVPDCVYSTRLCVEKFLKQSNKM